MSNFSTGSCSGYCLPLYIYGGITAANIGAHLVFEKDPFMRRLWHGFQSFLWSLIFGLLIYLLCKFCQPQLAYIFLVPPSIIFGFNMFWLLLKK